jgi:hypothetical protein
MIVASKKSDVTATNWFSIYLLIDSINRKKIH